MKNLTIKNGSKNYSAGKLVCVGRNYKAHAEELGNEVPEFPIIFLKPNSVLIQSGEEIIHPEYSKDLHHEVELVLLIGKEVKNANDEEAEDAIAGYAVGLDMTLRDIQSELKKNGHPWTLAKVFDGSALVSEFVLKEDYQLRGKEEITLSVNNEIRQKAALDKMIFDAKEIVKYISSKMKLEEGDLIFTGTPEGVGKVERGDTITASIENIGSLYTKIK